MASEASYAYILSEQKFIKNAKNSQFENLTLAVKQCYQMRLFWWISNIVNLEVQEVEVKSIFR